MHQQSRQYFGGILVVDDDPSVQKLLATILNEFGYQIVFMANNGLEAVSTLETYEEGISVVLLDLMMPKMDGVAFLRHLVNVHHTPVAIVVQTGHPDGLTREAFFALGTDTILPSEYITKPFTPSRIIAEVEKAFICVEKKRKALQRESEARLHARLEQIETTLRIVEKNQHGFLTELGLDLVKAVLIAIALLALLYLGVGDFVKMVLPIESSGQTAVAPRPALKVEPATKDQQSTPKPQLR